MVKFMLKLGVVNDLARIPHSLDMSSPLMPFTVNAALKPLEALPRIINLPPTTPAPGVSAKSITTADAKLVSEKLRDADDLCVCVFAVLQLPV